MDEYILTTLGVTELGGVVMRTTIIFLYAFILLRLLGKRRLSHVGYIDLLLIIAFGSAVGDVMIYSESTTHLLTSMAAITVVSIIVKLLNEFSSHTSFGNHIVDGHAQLLIDKGVIVDGVLAKEDLSQEKIDSYLREKGIESVKHVRKAFIEPDGEISVIPYRR
jgi:uncharacterized membrane protein YcaP (DUF421 family)